MPIIYTNRKGVSYYLCQGTTKTVKPRYYFARQPKDKMLSVIPESWEIRESVNGVVSLVKQRPQQIVQEELASVRNALERHAKANRYRADVKDDQITVYEQVGPDAAEILEGMSDFLGLKVSFTAQHLRKILAEQARYAAIVRFTLVDETQRLFAAERMSYLGARDRWLYTGYRGPIDALAQELIPLLDTDEFFELF